VRASYLKHRYLTKCIKVASGNYTVTSPDFGRINFYPTAIQSDSFCTWDIFPGRVSPKQCRCDKMYDPLDCTKFNNCKLNTYIYSPLIRVLHDFINNIINNVRKSMNINRNNAPSKHIGHNKQSNGGLTKRFVGYPVESDIFKINNQESDSSKSYPGHKNDSSAAGAAAGSRESRERFFPRKIFVVVTSTKTILKQ
jgi:hypothetical protein